MVTNDKKNNPHIIRVYIIKYLRNSVLSRDDGYIRFHVASS
jgi:hypothetical protein